jgi:GT2 family glycosyltransferase
MGEFSVALANWNGSKYIERCLGALYAQTRVPREIVVVDNGSTDGSCEWIAAQYPQVKLLINKRNEGFAAGYNRAIAACTCEWVLILNTDVFIEVDFVKCAFAALETSPGVGAVTGRIYQQGTSEWLNSGFFLRPQMRTRHSEKMDVEEDVFGCSGALILFRRAMLDDIAVEGQYFDECYFCYGEDIDLAWRARLLGWAACYVPDARAVHVGSGASEERLRFVDKSVFLQRHILKNRYLTIVKNASLLEALCLAPFWLLGEPLVWLVLFIRGPRRCLRLLPALSDAVRLLPHALRWRRSIQGRRTMSPVKILRYFRWI